MGTKGAAAHGGFSGGVGLMARTGVATVGAVVCRAIMGVAMAPTIAGFGIGVVVGVVVARASFERCNLLVFFRELEGKAFNGGSECGHGLSVGCSGVG